MKTAGRKPYLHVTVSSALRARIVSRETPPGAILPGEHKLAQDFGVSRSVIRQALRTLADEGFVKVVPGRGALVVAQPEWHRDAQRTTGLSAQMRALGARVGTRVLTYEVQHAGEQAARLGSEEALFLERLRLLDGAPVAFIRTWLPAWVTHAIRAEHLEDESLHVQLRERAGILVQGGPRRIRAVAVAEGMAERLGAAPGSPVLLLEGENVDQAGRTVEVFSTWHRSDRIVLDVRAHEPAQGRAAAAPVADADALRQAEAAALETLRLIRELGDRSPGGADRL